MKNKLKNLIQYKVNKEKKENSKRYLNSLNMQNVIEIIKKT